MYRSALLLLSGNAVTSVLLFMRNLLVARLIPVAEFGIGSTFGMVMAVVDMISAIGLQQQIIQSKSGDDERFQAALQGFQFIRGTISALILLALAGPISQFLRVPEVAWAYRLLAIVPFVMGLQHFDMPRFTRAMKFWPGILSGAATALITLVLVWPLAHWFGDWRVMLFSILAQACLTIGISHLLAKRRYRLVFDRKIMAGSLRFGWPLLVNNVLLFAVFNGDKMIVGREMGMEMLAIFAMGFTLTQTPTLILAKSAQSYLLPQLSAAHHETEDRAAKFYRVAMGTMQAGLLMGVALIVAIALVGQPVVEVLLGEKYLPLLTFLPWLAIMQALRVFKAGPSLIALATGYTENAMIANIIRVASLPFAWLVAIRGGELMTIIAIAIAAEAIGALVAVWQMRRRVKIGLRGVRLPAALFLAVLVFSGVWPHYVAHFGMGLAGWLGTLILLLLALAALASMTHFRAVWSSPHPRR